MPISPIPNQINNNIFFELFPIKNQPKIRIKLPVIISQLHNRHHALRIIGIDMNNRSSNCLSHVGAVLTASGLLGGCSESDLVVDYYVDYTTHFESLQVLHLQGFVHYALTGKCSVTVH
jgi:hypothetical protein